MFCPKCGNNCGDNRFCGHCGAQVQTVTEQKPQQTAWSVGMACPHCGGTKLEGKNCAFCGAQLMADLELRDGNSGNKPLHHGNVDLSDYFERYSPNRANAIKALRRDTGLGIVEAKSMIDRYFDERLDQSHDKDVSVARRNFWDAVKSAQSKK